MALLWLWALGAASVILVLLVAGYLYQKRGEKNDARRNPPQGRIVSIGSRRLHLRCKGAGAPTVVIEQGAGEPARFWWPLQDQIAQFAAVCTYDRAGYGWSDPAPSHRSLEDRAHDLYALLASAAIPGPYVFVAHSYGGLIVRSFARQYPGQTAGIVLVDTPHEASIFRRDILDFYSKMRVMIRIAGIAARFGVLRLLNHWVNLEAVGFSFIRPSEYAAAADDLSSLEILPQPAFGSLGDLPLAIITHGQPFPGPFAILESGWAAGQSQLAALSTRSRIITAARSNHMIQIDEPDLVLDAIREVVRLAAVASHLQEEKQ